MNKVMLLLALVMSGFGFCATQITDLTVTPIPPFCKVIVEFNVEGDAVPSANLWRLSCTEVDSGKAYSTTQVATVTDGHHRLDWDMAADGIRLDNKAVTFKVEYQPLPTYLVIDLSGGTSATSYPVTALAAPPEGGWTDEYKTTKLVLRVIEAGSYKMNGSYDVTISQPFYMGVFEVTQKQYQLVTGSNLARYRGDARPMESVSWDTIRGSNDWPNDKTVDNTSFMGILRAKTGLELDLPTDAQWEYACRAGTTSKYNNGGNTEADLNTLGRYCSNGGSDRQHAKVGSYLPNAWGLYDMHGNVWEWCLDWYRSSLSSGTDPKGPTSGLEGRVKRGGSWRHDAAYCTSSHRNSNTPWYTDYDIGFRLACPAVTDGHHRLEWDMAADGIRLDNKAVPFKVEYLPLPTYLVIDLSGGTSATSYPVAALAAPPEGGWTDEYKTTKLVLRRIESGSYKEDGPFYDDVTISQPFYMGVFEVTQKQYQLVTGSNLARYRGDARPMESISWDTIRGSKDWPNDKTVDNTSFMGKLRAKTGLELDLPTDAQWEYACRAGTTSHFNNGGNLRAALDTLGRYCSNGGSDRQHAKVGSYLPNAWGLYDMHGNVWEWCLDWYELSSPSGTDPKGPTSGWTRVLRGGGWKDSARDCASSSRDLLEPSSYGYNIGFRLACPAGL